MASNCERSGWICVNFVRAEQPSTQNPRYEGSLDQPDWLWTTVNISGARDTFGKLVEQHTTTVPCLR